MKRLMRRPSRHTSHRRNRNTNGRCSYSPRLESLEVRRLLATAGKELFAQDAIEIAGATGNADYYGSGNDDPFAEYGIASFRFIKADFGLGDGDTITGITSADYSLTHNDRSFSDGSEVEFFLSTDVFEGDFSGLSFAAANINGIDAAQYGSAPISLGVFSYTPKDGGVVDTFSLDFSPAATEVIDKLNSGEEFNIIIAATTADADITFSGLDNGFDPGNPLLNLVVTETAGTDTAPPRIVDLTPADDATEVAADTNLTIRFHEGVELGAGSVTVKLASDSSEVELIDVASERVTVDGDTVTIDPTDDFANSTAYYVEVSAGAFTDLAGNAFPGVVDATTWNFEVADPDNPPVFEAAGPFAVSVNAAAGTIVGDVDANDDGNGADAGVHYAITAGNSNSSMMAGVNGYSVTPLFTVGEVISGTTGTLNPTSAGSYQPVGILDGIGGFELDDNTVRVFVNHELTSGVGHEYEVSDGDGGTVALRGARISYFDIDKETRSIVDSGLAYGQIFDRAGNVVADPNQLDFEALNRLCSGSLFEAESFGPGQGLADRIYFAGEESGGGTEFALDVDTGNLWAVPAMGRAAWENVTLIDTGNTTHVAFLIGDDRAAAPLYLYVGEKGAVGDGSFLDRNGLAAGKVYAWVADSGAVDASGFNGTLTGILNPVDGTWVEIALLNPGLAGQPGYDALGYADQATQDSLADDAGHFAFSRPEDLATDPNDGTRAVMASTGRGSLFPDDDWGTTYLITTDFSDFDNPTSSISILYDGDMAGNQDNGMRSPDNLDWADDGFIYIQEDRSTSIGSFGGDSGREASIWKLDPATGEATHIAEMNRDAVLPLGSTDPVPSDIGNWESSGILDVSTFFGEAPGTLFVFDVQAHSIRDGVIADADLVQGGQLSFLELGGETGAFKINSNGGVISLVDPAALGGQDTYVLTVQAYDGVNSSFQQVTIELNDDSVPTPSGVRLATFNASLNRPAEGGLIESLSTPDDAQARDIAAIIQSADADILLINEFDYDADGVAADLFRENYLEVGQHGQSPVFYPYVFNAESNTGIPSGLDLDNNGSIGGGNDAYGFGTFPGQFGMVLFSKYPIVEEDVRTFQHFLWKDMPNALLPADPDDADGNGDTANWFTADELDAVRLSSKSHWDVPIDVNGTVIHALASHPTPPVFDGPEDRNGTRNHDEIRFWSDYVTPGSDDYIYDDAEFAAAGDTTPAAPGGGLAAGESFVIMGDLNADPFDGDSTNSPALLLVENTVINNSVVPSSEGGVAAAAAQGGANADHTGDPAEDTSDFNDVSPGNLRVDYVLPSADLTITNAEVVWPVEGDLATAVTSSDHRLVLVDVATDTFTLQILHASDLEGGVDAVGDAPNFAAVVEALEDDAADSGVGSITLSAGDNFIPGPFFNAAGDGSLRPTLQAAYQEFFGEAGLTNIREGGGRVDISVMNVIGFDAAAVGNHEFDAGAAALSGIIGTDIRGDSLGDVRWLGAQFPYLSANLDFSTEASLAGLATTSILPSTAFQSTPDDLQAAGDAPKLAPATTIEVNGEIVGVVGATTQLLSQISSPGGTTHAAGTETDMQALADVLNPVIAELEQVSNKIILVSHLQQISLEQELARLLEGVDVIIAGGSDTLLADASDRLRVGDTAANTYPQLAANADGDPVAIVSTDGEYSYVGRLVVSFSPDGKLLPASIDAAQSGVFATDAAGVTDLWGSNDAFAEGSKGAQVRRLTGAVQQVVTEKDSQVFGQTDVFLEGRRTAVRTEETNLGNLTADANLAAARVVDSSVQVSIKNGGGIRAEIGSIDGVTGEQQPPEANPLAGKLSGEVSQLDIENSLRFNNQLTLLTVTATELKQLLEHGVARSGPGVTPGQFPQVGGLSFSFDPSRQAIAFDGDGVVAQEGHRIRSLVLLTDDGSVAEVVVEDGRVVGDADRSIRLVTLNFLAGGGDGYPFDAFGSDVVETEIGEQTAMAEFLAANYSSAPYNQQDTPIGLDKRIQNLSRRTDTVIPLEVDSELVLSAVGSIELEGAEIGAYDPVSQMMVVTGGSLQFVDVSDVTNPTLIATINAQEQFGFGSDEFTSVAIKNGVVAASLPAAVEQDPGRVLLFTSTGSLIGSVRVGALPDMLTFTPDGTKILVANEGEADGDVDPQGSVSIIDVSGVRRGVFGFGFHTVTVQTADFTAFDGRENEFRGRGVRIFPGKVFSQDVEPEYIAVSPDGESAFITLQENNAFGVLDIAAAEIIDVLPMGLKDHSQGLPELTEYEFDPSALGVLGTDANGVTYNVGGFSGLWFDGMADNGNYRFLTVGDRGPNGDTAAGQRPFLLPDYQSRIVALELNPGTGELKIVDEIFLTRDTFGTPVTGLPNIPGVDEVPVDAVGAELPYDPYGADMESITRAPDGSLWLVDEYRPSIYHFSADGQLIDRYVPEGTAAQVGQPAGTYGNETLPSDYLLRRRNRGFEAGALDTDTGIFYAFIQTPLGNDGSGSFDRATSDASSVIRILGIDPSDGEPVAEYVYYLQDSKAGNNVDKIGDAVYDPSTGNFFVIERDSSTSGDAQKFIFEVDLSAATNLLAADAPSLLDGKTLEQHSVDDLAAVGIQPVSKLKVTNLPSLGYLPSDKPEGIALLPGGSLAVLNDNDFGIDPSVAAIGLGVIDFSKSSGLDASDRDDAIHIQHQPVYGMFMPDAIASYAVDGITYYITANEGDARDEDVRIKDLTLDLTVFPNAEMLQQDSHLGRLQASSIDGDLDGDGDYDRLHVYGGRSFSIWDGNGNLVFDSGDQIARITASMTPELFNADDGDPDEFDNRSDNKGAEPEGVTVGHFNGTTLAFVGLERAGGGVLVYDVTDPHAPVFLQYVRNMGDVSPEGLTFVSADDSPSGKALLAVTNEESNTLTIFELASAGNNAPQLDMADHVVLSGSQGSVDVELVATDADGGTLTFSAVAESSEYHFDQMLGLNFTGSFFEDFGGLNEKWLQGDDGTWYFITPDGGLFEWLGGGVRNRRLVGSVSQATYEFPARLYDAEPGSAPATVSVNGNTLAIDPEDGFVGTFVVNLVVSDGFLSDTSTIEVTVRPNQAPVVSNPGDQTLPASQETLEVALDASDADGDTLTYSTVVHSAEYYLDQTIGLNFTGDFFENFGGLGEKWLLSDGGVWYYITPDGNFWQWLGGAARNANLVTTLPVSTFDIPATLYDAQPGGGPATATVDGSTLTVNADAGYVGLLAVEVTASDGSLADSTMFLVTVTPPAAAARARVAKALPMPAAVTHLVSRESSSADDRVAAAGGRGRTELVFDELDPSVYLTAVAESLDRHQELQTANIENELDDFFTALGEEEILSAK